MRVIRALLVNRTKKDGLATRCKECNNSNFAMYYQQNKEYHKEQVKIRKDRIFGPAKPRLPKHEKFWSQVQIVEDGCWPRMGRR